MRYDTSMINWKKLTVEQLKNHIECFKGTDFEMSARAELQRRGLPQV